MKSDSPNMENIKSLNTTELVQYVRTAMREGRIHPCYIYDMVDELLQRIAFLTDDIKDLETDNQDLRKGMVAQCHCKHFKGLHENEYADCLVVCDKYNDDYVSMASCQSCGDFELSEGAAQSQSSGKVRRMRITVDVHPQLLDDTLLSLKDCHVVSVNEVSVPLSTIST